MYLKTSCWIQRSYVSTQKSNGRLYGLALLRRDPAPPGTAKHYLAQALIHLSEVDQPVADRKVPHPVNMARLYIGPEVLRVKHSSK